MTFAPSGRRGHRRRLGTLLCLCLTAAMAGAPAHAGAQIPDLQVPGTGDLPGGAAVDDLIDSSPSSIRDAIRPVLQRRRAPGSPTRAPKSRRGDSGRRARPGRNAPASPGRTSSAPVRPSGRTAPGAGQGPRTTSRGGPPGAGGGDDRRRGGGTSRVAARPETYTAPPTAYPPAGPTAGTDDGDAGEPGTVERIVEVVPGPVKVALGVLALLALLLALGYSRTGLRARRLNRQREKLLEDIGMLQAALLPTVPEKLGDLGVSVAYRPAEGPGAGGDFYDAFAIDDDRVALIVGDISGHGREALGHTTLVHYTLRAYLEAGLEPRNSLQLAGQAMGDKLGESFATVVAARWDSRSGTVTYACAGHPPPVFAPDGAAPEPVTALSSPPIGVGEPTGRRQTTITLPSGSVACFFTDGLIEARVDGKLFGRERLTRMVAELTRAGPASAQALLDRVRRASDEVSDDMAACVLSPGATRRCEQFWTEELELDDRDARQPELELFLAACHLDAEEIQRARAAAEAEVERAGGVVLSVRHHAGASRWEVGPREVETLLHGTGVAAPAAAGAR